METYTCEICNTANHQWVIQTPCCDRKGCLRCIGQSRQACPFPDCGQPFPSGLHALYQQVLRENVAAVVEQCSVGRVQWFRLGESRGGRKKHLQKGEKTARTRVLLDIKNRVQYIMRVVLDVTDPVLVASLLDVAMFVHYAEKGQTSPVIGSSYCLMVQNYELAAHGHTPRGNEEAKSEEEGAGVGVSHPHVDPASSAASETSSVEMPSHLHQLLAHYENPTREEALQLLEMAIGLVWDVYMREGEEAEKGDEEEEEEDAPPSLVGAWSLDVPALIHRLIIQWTFAALCHGSGAKARRGVQWLWRGGKTPPQLLAWVRQCMFYAATHVHSLECDVPPVMAVDSARMWISLSDVLPPLHDAALSSSSLIPSEARPGMAVRSTITDAIRAINGWLVAGRVFLEHAAWLRRTKKTTGMDAKEMSREMDAHEDKGMPETVGDGESGHVEPWWQHRKEARVLAIRCHLRALLLWKNMPQPTASSIIPPLLTKAATAAVWSFSHRCIRSQLPLAERDALLLTLPHFFEPFWMQDHMKPAHTTEKASALSSPFPSVPCGWLQALLAASITCDHCHRPLWEGRGGMNILCSQCERRRYCDRHCWAADREHPHHQALCMTSRHFFEPLTTPTVNKMASSVVESRLDGKGDEKGATVSSQRLVEADPVSGKDRAADTEGLYDSMSPHWGSYAVSMFAGLMVLVPLLEYLPGMGE